RREVLRQRLGRMRKATGRLTIQLDDVFPLDAEPLQERRNGHPTYGIDSIDHDPEPPTGNRLRVDEVEPHNLVDMISQEIVPPLVADAIEGDRLRFAPLG